MALDVITLRGLTARAVHGVLAVERTAAQPFRADVSLWVDSRRAVASDDIEETVSYADVADAVVEVLTGPSANLIETLAHRIADAVLAFGPVVGVEVTVHKPQAPIAQEFDDVAVTVRRGVTGAGERTSGGGVIAADAERGVAGVTGRDTDANVEERSAEATPVGEDAEAAEGAASVPAAAADVERPAAANVPDGTPGGEGAGREVVLALGGNLGDVPVTLAGAVRALVETEGVEVVDVSPLLRTAPVLAPGQDAQPDYWNAVVLARTTLTPGELLGRTQAIEQAFGRVRLEHWGARTLDIDIVDVEGVTSSDPRLTLPHPRAAQRAFVLVPWLMVAPDAMLGRHRIADLALAAEDRAGIRDAVSDWLEDAERVVADSDRHLSGEPVEETTDVAPVEDVDTVDGEGGDTSADAAEHVDATVTTVDEVTTVADGDEPASTPEDESAVQAEGAAAPVEDSDGDAPAGPSRLDLLPGESRVNLLPNRGGTDLLWASLWTRWARTPGVAADDAEVASEGAGDTHVVEADAPASAMDEATRPGPRNARADAGSADDSSPSPERSGSPAASAAPAPAGEHSGPDAAGAEAPGGVSGEAAPVEERSGAGEATDVADTDGKSANPTPAVPVWDEVVAPSSPAAPARAATPGTRASMPSRRSRRASRPRWFPVFAGQAQERPTGEATAADSSEVTLTSDEATGGAQQPTGAAATADPSGERPAPADRPASTDEAAVADRAEEEPRPCHRATDTGDEPVTVTPPTADVDEDDEEEPTPQPWTPGGRSLPSWDFRASEVHVVDDIDEDDARAETADAPSVRRRSVLDPSIADGLEVGPLDDPTPTSIMRRLTVRPTGVGGVPVPRRSRDGRRG